MKLTTTKNRQLQTNQYEKMTTTSYLSWDNYKLVTIKDEAGSYSYILTTMWR